MISVDAESSQRELDLMRIEQDPIGGTVGGWEASLKSVSNRQASGYTSCCFS